MLPKLLAIDDEPGVLDMIRGHFEKPVSVSVSILDLERLIRQAIGHPVKP